VRHRNRGADIGYAYLLPRLVGTMRAAHLLLTGADVDAEGGLKMGLFTEVVAADQLQAVADRTAQAMIASPPRRATAFAKMALFRGETTELETYLEYEMIT